MKRRWKWGPRVGAALLLLALGGFLVVSSGIIPIKASSGHWRLTAWFLNYTKLRSVATHTLGMELKGLDDRALVLKGAGHYDGGCRPCHGAPDLKHPKIPAAMTPHPPYLTESQVKKPEELFYVIKHGIKFTGMPAWPAQQRDDEVRALVAFVLQLSKLDGPAYRRLVDGEVRPRDAVMPLSALPEPRVPWTVRESCARCHGIDGQGRGVGAFPKLAGQRPEYFVGAMRAYAEGSRFSGIMAPIAVALSPTEWRELAGYYGEMSPEAGGLADSAVMGAQTSGGSERPPAADQGDVARGQRLAELGAAAQGVPSCIDCHGPGPRRRNSAYPSLAGQYRDYLELQLQLFDQGKRGGSHYHHLMNHVATRLTAGQMRDVAAFYASLRPGSERAVPK